ncbi:lactosylceramide 1,3-N-acetyl-beta-D-glucosaminyltransferase isoform X2 [Trichechus manatus latirostris]|uniref:Lactosylceramide 1,3-N-acetyl-beta-D-glucosaminyltransferase isoform X2 n=1 Tax=Trichechus manatus latirostris TaxID=127582 RepID=A0A2Y9RGH4_TRIMA|nr:lactosylceramide 1,3-N-acetyl-beta-D-glucosaminyltransferase isoform X2 [Trichechus manatus latirostris]XP_023592592.1 lactosylceramide 1,3-N-acetyl-beta-D-glucosaminyltransferase isoform X2 [Trichechus manatus latirostris]XP_023592593.1 lactosylceramide 1,3-N-acetyl-beta-D-glucosaminyltransferase isoform X2 [Trichechus manatus latirostris]
MLRVVCSLCRDWGGRPASAPQISVSGKGNWSLQPALDWARSLWVERGRKSEEGSSPPAPGEPQNVWLECAQGFRRRGWHRPRARTRGPGPARAAQQRPGAGEALAATGRGLPATRKRGPGRGRVPSPERLCSRWPAAGTGQSRARVRQVALPHQARL